MIFRPSRLVRFARWRTLRWVLALAVVPIVWACSSHPLEQPKPNPTQQTDLYYEVNPTRDLDILFMIDNSPSMMEEQNNLAAAFPQFMTKLQSIPGKDGKPQLPDVRIGIVSSDMGAGPTSISQCNRPGGDKAEFRVLPGCGLNANARYIVSLMDGTMNNFTGTLPDVFSCMAKLGVSGCGYEHQLLATWLALDPKPELSVANMGFLRPEAYLAIILITDEDDCSAPFDTDLFSTPQDIPGQTNSVRCAIKGHLCNGTEPPSMDFTAELSSCESNEKGKLFAVSDLVAEVMKLKPGRSDRIIVQAITGVPDVRVNPNAKYRLGKDKNGDLDYLPACETPGTGKATPALRIKKFVDAFGPDGLHNICTTDLTGAMTAIGEKVKQALINRCVEAALADGDLTMPGVQPDCKVVDRKFEAGNTVDIPIPECVGGGPRPCWKLDPNTKCASGFEANVDRNGGMAPPGTQQVVKCLTCAVHTGDPNTSCP